MTWFFIALIGSFLYACVNHTDKYLISRYLKGGEVGSLIIFSSIFSIIALPIVLYIDPAVFDVALLQGLALALNSTLVVFAILLYFYALHKDEASYVVPFYQTIPIFGFILGYFLLGETVTAFQGMSSIVIIAGAFVLSIEFKAGVIKFKKDVVLLMLASSLLYAVNGVVFKFLALENGFWPSIFWGLIGKIILGFMFLFFVPTYRHQFLTMLSHNKTAVLALNSLSESLFIAAEAITQFATLLAPVALVLLVNSFQPLFVFILGAIVTLLLPKIGRESLTKESIMQKIAGIGLMIVGAYFLGS